MSKTKKNEWKGYLNYTLSSKDKKKIKELGIEVAALIEWVEQMVEEGVATSFSWDSKSSGHKVTMTGRGCKTEFNGYSVTAWGGEIHQCLAVLHYLFNSGQYGEWLESIIPSDSADWW